jgi:hypothetical protein
VLELLVHQILALHLVQVMLAVEVVERVLLVKLVLIQVNLPLKMEVMEVMV